MSEIILTREVLCAFAAHLRTEEKSALTISKYLRDARSFADFARGRPISKELVLEFKSYLAASGRYKIGSINSILASANSLCRFLGRMDCCVKTLRTQKKIYCSEDRELTKAEYLRLLVTSKRQPRLCLILQTICSTGIRVSELRYFTVEAVRRGEVTVNCKNKTRSIMIPSQLQKKLLQYIKRCGIASGVIFRTRSGRPVDRSNIWSDMKRLCERANVNPSKVFPHNLRKLFARTFYGIEKDIAKLADILGHSSINTTRIYITAILALAIYIDSPEASPIFKQKRVGIGKKEFMFYKFRSMVPNAEAKLAEVLKDNEMDGPVFKIADDPRVTKVGKFIRKTSLDELPQLFNILKGDMSIVGPRPPLPREVEQHTEYDEQRLYAKPGLTCYSWL